MLRLKKGEPEWCDFRETIGCEIKLRPITIKIHKSYQRRNQTEIAGSPDGDNKVWVRPDVEAQWEAAKWVIGQLAVDVKGDWPDGEPMSFDEEWIESVADSTAKVVRNGKVVEVRSVDLIVAKAGELAGIRAEAEEGNSESSSGTTSTPKKSK